MTDKQRPYPELLDDAETKALLQRAEQLWADLQANNIGGFSGINRPFYIVAEFKRVIEEFGSRDVGLYWSKNDLDAHPDRPTIEPREPSLPNDVPALRELMDKLTTDYHAAMQPLIDQIAKINAMRAPAPVQARQCAKCGTIYAPELGGCYNCKPHRADHDGTT